MFDDIDAIEDLYALFHSDVGGECDWSGGLIMFFLINTESEHVLSMHCTERAAEEYRSQRAAVSNTSTRDQVLTNLIVFKAKTRSSLRALREYRAQQTRDMHVC